MTKRTAQGAATAAPAPAPAPAPAVAPATTPAASTVASGEQGADGAASTESTKPAAPVVEQAAVARVYEFPLNAIVRNHGPIAFPEPVSGAFLPAGGSATITLHDEDFAERVAESLRNIAETNYLAPGALEVGPAQ